MEVAQSSEDYAKRRGLFKERLNDYNLSEKSLRDSDEGPDPKLLERLRRRFGSEAVADGEELAFDDEVLSGDESPTKSSKDKKSKKKKKKKSKKKKSKKSKKSKKLKEKEEAVLSSSSLSSGLEDEKPESCSSLLSDSAVEDSSSSWSTLSASSSEREIASHHRQQSDSSIDSYPRPENDVAESSYSRQRASRGASSRVNNPAVSSSPENSDDNTPSNSLQELRNKRHQMLMRKRSTMRKTKGSFMQSVAPVPLNNESMNRNIVVAGSAKHTEDASLLKYFERAVRRCEEQFLAEEVELQPRVERSDEVKIELGEGVAAETPTTAVNQFELAVKNCQNQPAMKAQRDHDWVTWSWQEYYFDVVKAAKSIINLGIKRFESVNIIAQNSPEVAIVHFGCIFAGGQPIILYPSDSEGHCADLAIRTQASVIFVDSEAQLQKYINVVEDLSMVEAVVMWGVPEDECPNSITRYDIPVYCWEEFMALGVEVSNSELERRLDQQKPGHCCALAVTPNRADAGNAKITMLSHDNLNWSGFALTVSLIESVDWSKPTKEKKAVNGERTLSTGPLAHVDNLVLDLYAPLALAASFAKSQCTYYLLDPVASMHPAALVENLHTIKPTGFHAVPLVYEVLSIYLDEQHAANRENSKLGAKKLMGSFRRRNSKVGAKSVVSRLSYNSQQSNTSSRSSARSGFSRGSFKNSILNLTEALMSARGKGGLGLDNCRFLISHGSPLSTELLDDFARMQMVITECYGCNETSGITTIAPGSHKLSSLGVVLGGVNIRVRAASQQDEGELLFKGRNIMMGYMDSTDAVDSKVDKEGWYHSGDVGSIDSQDYVFLLGRKADSIVLAKGASIGASETRISPEPIERALKSRLPMIQSAVVFGNKKKHLTVMFTLHCTGDPNQPGEFLTRLAAPAQLDGCTTVEEAKKSATYMARMQQAIDWYNESDLCGSEPRKVRGFVILPRAFAFGGSDPELSGMFKPNRMQIQLNFRSELKQMYLPGFDSLKQTSYFGIKQARKAGQFNSQQGKFTSRKSQQKSVKLAVASAKSRQLNELQREEVYKTQRGVAKFILTADG